MATILVVDDEIGIRELLSEILIDEGHTVDTAQNAQEARDYRLKEEPDLVLLDIWMPDTDGVTLLKEWFYSNMLTMPVIMMSGHATLDMADEAARFGARNFLEKPIELKKLLKAVAQGLTHVAIPPKPIASSQVIPEDLLRPASAVASVMLTNRPPPLNINSAQSSMENVTISLEQPLREAREIFERIYFEYHLGREKGSMTRVAEKTGLERTHLYRKCRQLKIEKKDKSEEVN